MSSAADPFADVSVHWTARAACSGWEGPDLWFSHSRVDQSRAVAICHTCPVALVCLGVALNAGPGLSGVWGAMTQLERDRFLRSRDTHPAVTP